MKKNFLTKKVSSTIDPNVINYKGFLKKQGGKFRTMKRRYFVLVNEILFYFTNSNMTTKKGQINIKNLELNDIEVNGDGDFCFSLLPEKGKEMITENHSSYMLATNDRQEAQNWIFHLKQVLYLKRGGGLFGVKLSVVQPYLCQQYDFVPRIVYEICTKLKSIGFDEEGIFRKSGQKSEIERLRVLTDRADYTWCRRRRASSVVAQLKSDHSTALSPEDDDSNQTMNSNDVHNLCSLLKLYLRELPEPLVPFADYDELKAVGYRIEANEQIEMVSERLQKLPPANLQLLLYLCRFFSEVASHTSNLMTVSNIATVMSPNILRDEETDPYIEETTSDLISRTVAALINRHEDLFNFPINIPVRNGSQASSRQSSPIFNDDKLQNSAPSRIVSMAANSDGQNYDGDFDDDDDSDTYSMSSAISQINLKELQGQNVTILDTLDSLPTSNQEFHHDTLEPTSCPCIVVRMRNEDHSPDIPLRLSSSNRWSAIQSPSTTATPTRNYANESSTITKTTRVSSSIITTRSSSFSAPSMTPTASSLISHSQYSQTDTFPICIDCVYLKSELKTAHQTIETLRSQLETQIRERFQLQHQLKSIHSVALPSPINNFNQPLNDANGDDWSNNLLNHFNIQDNNHTSNLSSNSTNSP